MLAQTPPALEVSVTPAKVGTEAKPRPVKLALSLTGELDAAAVTVYFPKQLRITNSGLPQCDKDDAQVAAGACDDDKAGTGSITVAEQQLPLTPLVGAKDLIFKGGDTVLHGALSQAKGRYTAKMRIALPDPMRPFTALNLTMKRAGLFATRGCPLPFKVTAGSRILTAKARCR